MNTLLSLWGLLSRLGVNHLSVDAHTSEYKRLIIQNQIMLGSMMAIFLFLGIAGLYFPYFEPFSFFFHISLALLLLHGLWLNSRGHSAFTRFFVITLSPLYVAVMSVYIGQSSGMQYFLIITAMQPLLLYPPQKKFIFVYSILLHLLIFLGLHVFFLKGQAILEVSADTQQINYYLIFTFIAVLNVLSVYSFYMANVSLEEGLSGERRRYQNLLENVLPRAVVTELSETGITRPVHYECATVLFTDFEGFTRVSGRMAPAELVAELDNCFGYFDELMELYGLEKLKTIGDSYMCAGGIPLPNATHAVDCVLAGMAVCGFIEQLKIERKNTSRPAWEIRIGIHSGPLVAGVIGQKKFAYDVWGDTVNTASRLEAKSKRSKINISEETHEKIKDFFVCKYRGKQQLKGKGAVKMYFVERLQPRYSADKKGMITNDHFKEAYAALAASYNGS